MITVYKVSTVFDYSTFTNIALAIFFIIHILWSIDDDLVSINVCKTRVKV